MPRVQRCEILPDVGEVLGDKTFTEPLLDCEIYRRARPLLRSKFDSITYEEEELSQGSTSTVLYRIDGNDGEPFLLAMSPPPTHLVIESQVVHHESLEHYLRTSISTLIVSSNARQAPTLYAWLSTFLGSQPPTSPLHTLYLDFADAEDMIQKFTNEMSANCRLQHLCLHCEDLAYVHESLSTLKCHSLSVHASTALTWDSISRHFRNKPENLDPPVLKELELSCASLDPTFKDALRDMIHVLHLLELETCKLRRLDLKNLPPFKLPAIHELVKALRSPDCHIQDLGINLGHLSAVYWPSNWTRQDIENGNKSRHSALSKAFSESKDPPLSKLQALRFSNVNTDEAAQCVLDILSSPPSSCKVRFLEVHLNPIATSTPNSICSRFFRELQRVKARIECLRAFVHLKEHSNHHSRKGEGDDEDDASDEGSTSVSDIEDASSKDEFEDQLETQMSGLAHLIQWQTCPLVHLECEFETNQSTAHKAHESLELHLANALQENHRLLMLQIPWKSEAAQSRAAAFLARNHLYKAALLDSTDELSKPQTARLFLCGHGQVGKSTICKTLLKLNHQNQNHVIGHSLISQAAACINCCWRICTCGKQEEPRTRGLEIHKLHFQEGPAAQKLVIFDLAGQADYHVFHHYFMTNTSNDLFMVVCKYNMASSSIDDSHLASQLEYWLKFVVSHRNTVNGHNNPKIMLVLNFFPPISPQDDMQSIADDITAALRTKYADVLDFGTGSLEHVFGVNALSTNQIRPLLTTLGVLLTDLLDRRPEIPKICDDLLSSALPELTCHLSNQSNSTSPGMMGWCQSQYNDAPCRKASKTKKVIVAFEQVKYHYLQPQKAEATMAPEKLEIRIQVGLTELHNMGEVVFFPPARVSSRSSSMSSVEDQGLLVDRHAVRAESSSTEVMMLPIITDPHWFCNKVVGDLLLPEELGGRFQWSEKDIRQIIRKNGCPTQYINELLRYMISVELCYVVKGYGQNGQVQIQYFFPAVARKEEPEWPGVFQKQNSSSNVNCYGRRLRCKNSEKHLIPSGVFARLQVKLHKFCGEGNDRSYKMGYRWVSFVKDAVGVMVRFGGEGTSHGRSARNALAAPTSQNVKAHSTYSRMEQDDHPEWIDIFICSEQSPSLHENQEIGQRPNMQAISKEDTIMNGIKHLIYKICQATSRSIPTVVLEEWIFKDVDQPEDVVPLDEAEKVIRKKGLEATISWPSQDSTAVIGLLLPEELKQHIMEQVDTMKKMQEEFISDNYIEQDGSEASASDDADQLTGEIRILYNLLRSDLDKVTGLLQKVRHDVHELQNQMRQMEINIVSKCSTQLLKQLLVIKGNLPVYLYLSEKSGKLKKLKKFLVQKTATVHFMCETSAHGPHKVEGQLGKEVTVEAGKLIKAAPFLVPALKVMCCAAKFAVNLFLPGIAPPGIFEPLLDCLKQLGITAKELQEQQILPKALNSLFDGINVELQKFYDKSSKQEILHQDKGALKESVEAIQSILGHKDLDMQKDFGLYLVMVKDKPSWVCKEHARGYTAVQHPKNPFS